MSEISFGTCLATCSRTPELVAEFDRLTGHHLSTLALRTPIEGAIDKATGRDRAALLDWISFVWECIWTRLDLAATGEDE